MGRPPSKPVKLRDGYYIEIHGRNEDKGIKIRRDSLKQIEVAKAHYKGYYEVKDLRKLEKVKWIDQKK